MVVKNNDIVLKTDSYYYYQIQGQMHITGRNSCYFFMFTPKWTKLEIIRYNETFWKTKMEPYLTL